MKLLTLAIGFTIGAIIGAPVGYMICALFSISKLNDKNEQNKE